MATELVTRRALDAGAPPGFRIQPHNIEAEQALLGSILINNEAYQRVADFLRPEHFYEPVHARVYETIERLISRGQLADPVTLKTAFDQDEALRDLDGAHYLAGMARVAQTIVNVEHYGRLIHDLALRRGLITIGEEVVNRAYDPATPEAGHDQIEAAEQELFRLAQQGLVDGDFRSFPPVLTSAVDMIEAAFHKEGRVTGVPTLLEALDEKLGGLQRSDLIILAARPSMGKTALAVSVAANAARTRAPASEAQHLKSTNYTVAVFSLEMSAEQLAMRLLAAETGISSDDLRHGKLKDDQFAQVVSASNDLANRPIFIDETPALSVSALRTRARRLQRQQGLSLIVVDYVQLMTTGRSSREVNRVQEISEITQGLKAVAKELNVPVLALSQLSRAVEQREDKRPQLSDLRESGAIEQDADVVMFIYRDEYYQERAEPKIRDGESDEKFQERYNQWLKRYESCRGAADVIIAKQRNGPIGSIQLMFDPARSRFADFEYRDMTTYGY